MACSTWGNYGGGSWQVDVLIDSKGGVEVRSGVQDIGTGTRTVLTLIVAEELGIPASQVTCKLGDSNYPPGPGSGGSVTATSVGPAARTGGKIIDSAQHFHKEAGERQIRPIGIGRYVKQYNEALALALGGD